MGLPVACFDPVIEFMRSVSPLVLIPLVIIGLDIDILMRKTGS